MTLWTLAPGLARETVPSTLVKVFLRYGTAATVVPLAANGRDAVGPTIASVGLALGIIGDRPFSAPAVAAFLPTVFPSLSIMMPLTRKGRPVPRLVRPSAPLSGGMIFFFPPTGSPRPRAA